VSTDEKEEFKEALKEAYVQHISDQSAIHPKGNTYRTVILTFIAIVGSFSGLVTGLTYFSGYIEIPNRIAKQEIHSDKQDVEITRIDHELLTQKAGQAAVTTTATDTNERVKRIEGTLDNFFRK
jgi:hypothetical protein